MAARLPFACFSASGLLAALALAGCNTLDASADHTMAEQRLAPPAAIVVHTFAIAPQAAVSSSSSGDADQAARAFRDSLAAQLITQIQAMGLPAQNPDAALPPAGNVVTLEGRFVSIPAADSAEPEIVRLAHAWPDVVVDVEIYDTTETSDRLVEDFEFQISETSALVPAATTGGPTIPAAKSDSAAASISPAVQTKLDAAARDGGHAIAKKLEPFFADQGWLTPAPGS